MSLLLEIIRQLLDYFGIPAEQLVQIWESHTIRHRFIHVLVAHLPLLLPGRNLQLPERWETKEFGWTRSIVRVIGTLLPLDPCPRPHFQHITNPGAIESKENGTVCRPGIPSLTDVTWLSDEETIACTRFRYNLPGKNFVESISLLRPSKSNPLLKPFDKDHQPTSDNAIQKIAALENELAQLRAQIASIVAVQETKNVHSCSESLCSFGSPSNALPPPSLTSTPFSTHLLQSVEATPTPPPPPPPPPLPPPPPASSSKLNTSKSVIDLIKQRKAAHKHSPQEKEVVENDSDKSFPSMLDVLKDMNKITLRAVERSPGGTPLTRKDKKRRSVNDPAAIIAHALKKKFAHRQTEDSLEKENRSYEESPFSSPETPQFGRHLLKPIGKRTQANPERKPTLVKIGPHV